MTVQDIIDRLRQFPPNSKLVGYFESEEDSGGDVLEVELYFEEAKNSRGLVIPGKVAVYADKTLLSSEQ